MSDPAVGIESPSNSDINECNDNNSGMLENVEQINVANNPVSPCMSPPPSVEPFDIIDAKEMDLATDENERATQLAPNEIETPVETMEEMHETVAPKCSPSPCNLPPLNEDDDEEEDCSCTTTGSRSPTPVQFEITPKGVKVISDKESFL